MSWSSSRWVRMLVPVVAVTFGAGVAVWTAPSAVMDSDASAQDAPVPATGRSAAGEVGTFDDAGVPLFDVGAALNAMVADAGVAEAVSTFLRWVSSNEAFARACHNEAHRLGADAARSGVDHPERYATAQCDFGFIHGVLKATALDAAPGSDPNELASICRAAPDDVKVACEHGLGHAVPLRDDLSLTESLDMCERLDSVSASSQCVLGATMEFGVNDMYFHDLRSIDPASAGADGVVARLDITPAERAAPCAPLADASLDARDICYRHLHYFWSSELGRDYASFARRCATLVDDPNGACFASLGIWAWYEQEAPADAPVATHRDILDRSCVALNGARARDACLEGYFHSVWQTERRPLPSICEALGGTYERGCLTAERKFRTASS